MTSTTSDTGSDTGRETGSDLGRDAPGGPVAARQLVDVALRQLGGIGLVLVAAQLVRLAGVPGQPWAYVAIAGALVPQLLVVLLALRVPRRRERLGVSRRPSPLLAAAAAVIGLASAGTWLDGGSGIVAVAGVCAALGLASAAAPTRVVSSG